MKTTHATVKLTHATVKLTHATVKIIVQKQFISILFLEQCRKKKFDNNYFLIK